MSVLHETPDLTLHVNSYTEYGSKFNHSGHWICKAAIRNFWPEVGDIIQLVVHEHPSKNRVKITNPNNRIKCVLQDYLFICDGKLTLIPEKAAKILNRLLSNRKAVYVECLIDG